MSGDECTAALQAAGEYSVSLVSGSGSLTFVLRDLVDTVSLVSRLKAPSDEVSRFVQRRLQATTRTHLSDWKPPTQPPGRLLDRLVEDLNSILVGASIAEECSSFAGRMRDETRRSLASNPRQWDLVRLNRLLLEDAFPREISRDHGNNLIGSATLVSIGRSHGLLTADHVWQALRRAGDYDHFVMVLGGKHGRVNCPFKDCTSFVVGEYSEAHKEEGPDLVFIRFDYVSLVGVLTGPKSFYPIEAEKEQLIRDIPYARCGWVVSGTPQEGTFTKVAPDGMIIARMNQWAGRSDFESAEERDGFDYVKIRITRARDRYPAKYGGVSGGGVWIPVKYADAPLVSAEKPMVSLVLAGVAYYDTEDPSEETHLSLHGPKSIYTRLIDHVLHAEDRARDVGYSDQGTHG